MSVLILAALLVTGSYLISTSNSENKIANVQFLAAKNYYLAEAGINDMLWKIKNDEAARTAFLNGTLSSSYDISRDNIFGDANASYQVTAQNTVPAEAWVIATSTYQIAGSVSQRVVKSYISRAIGSGEEWEYGVFAGGRGAQQNGNFVFTGAGTVLISNDGRLHANQIFKVQGCEIVVNDGAVTASNNIVVIAGGQLTLNNSYQDSPTTTINVLPIDIEAWETRATATYTQSQFNSLPSGTTLDGIIYVSGDANIIDKNFTINGVLVAEEDIEIILSGQTVTVNPDPAYGGGLLTENDVNFNTTGGTVTINGLIYSGDDLKIISAGTNFTVNGSMTGFDARVTASGGAIILNHVLENFQSVIEPEFNPDAPLIQIDHWEEQY